MNDEEDVKTVGCLINYRRFEEPYFKALHNVETVYKRC